MGRATARVLTPAEYADWDRLVAESPGGSIYSTSAYLDALCTAAGGGFRVVALRRGDALVGGVALYERTTVFGRMVSPRLLLYYNGIVLRRYETKHPSQATSKTVDALCALEEWLSDQGYGAIHLKNRSAVSDVRPFVSKGWTVRPSYTYVLPLRDLAGLWERMEQNLRRLVTRCAERDGVTCHADDDFGTFYRLHEITLGRRGIAAYLPRDVFRSFFEVLQREKLARVFHARLADGRPIASQLVLLGDHPVCHTVSAAGDPEYNKLGAQAFLRWEVNRALAEMGYGGNDLTDAALNSVTRFKAQLGGDLEMSLALHSRQRPGYRWGTRALGAARWVRRKAGALSRRLLPRGER